MNRLRCAAMAAAFSLIAVGCISGCGGARFGPGSRPITRLGITGSGDTVAVGKQLVLTARAFSQGDRPENVAPGDLTWTLSDAAKATIATNPANANATLTAVSEGPVAVTVRHRNGVESAAFAVTITPATDGPATADRVRITPRENNVVTAGGAPILLTASAFAGEAPVSINAGDLIWTSSDDAVASVTAVEGSTDAVAVTGKSTGEVRITVTYKNLAAVTDTVSVRVDPGGNPALPVTRIEILAPPGNEVLIGGPRIVLDVRAFSGDEVVPLDAGTIEWRPVDASRVDLEPIAGSNGVYVTGKIAGDAEIEAVYKNNPAVTTRIAVKVIGTADGVPITIR